MLQATSAEVSVSIFRSINAFFEQVQFVGGSVALLVSLRRRKKIKAWGRIFTRCAPFAILPPSAHRPPSRKSFCAALNRAGILRP